MVTCDILPPDRLHIPVLPVRFTGKLFFPLCQSCMVNSEKGYCTHTNTERKLFGTWGTPEIELALTHGYRLLRFVISK